MFWKKPQTCGSTYFHVHASQMIGRAVCGRIRNRGNKSKHDNIATSTQGILLGKTAKMRTLHEEASMCQARGSCGDLGWKIMHVRTRAEEPNDIKARCVINIKAVREKGVEIQTCQQVSKVRAAKQIVQGARLMAAALLHHCPRGTFKGCSENMHVSVHQTHVGGLQMKQYCMFAVWHNFEQMQRGGNPYFARYVCACVLVGPTFVQTLGP
jgi:hypothetical protein